MPINFPSSPTDGQLYAVDNTTYYYDSVYNVWLTSLVPPQENKALSNSANTANAGYLNANAAFDKANSANVLAYNTGIAANNYAGFMANSANAYAASLTPDLSPAFNKANDAFTVASASFDKANSANVLAYNTGIGANNYAGVMANSANGYATAIVDANLVTARAYTNTSTDAANNYAGAMANSANVYAASLTPDLSPAFNKANTALDAANQAGVVANNVNTYSATAYVKLNVPGTTQTITSDIAIQGNLTISGNTTSIYANNLSVIDSLIYLAANNDQSDIVDIGFVGHYNNGSANLHTGLYRDHASKQYYLFNDMDGPEPETINDLVPYANGMVNAVLNADLISSNLTLGGANAIIWITASYDKANAANVLAYNTGISANNYAGVMANSANAYAASLTPDLSPAFNKANDAYTIANAAFDKANTGGGGGGGGITTGKAIAIALIFGG